MKTWFILGAMWMASTAALGQAGSGIQLQFQFSKLVLASGDTLTGPVAVRMGADLLYLAQADGTVRTFAPAAVAAVAVQGEQPNPALANTRPVRPPDPAQVRLFRTLLWNQGHAGTQPEPTFFEQLSPGPVLLLRRQYLIHRMAQLDGAGGINGTSGTVMPGVFGTTNGAGGVGRGLAPPPPPTRYGTLTEIRDNYYLALASGEIIALRAPKKELLAAFPNHAQQLNSYVQQHQLNYANIRDLVDLISYGNALVSASPP